MPALYLHLLVFVCGGAVLALEIVGTRVLGPFYGVSLFLWSALITVTLAALSAGYAIGGRWADRGANIGRLSSVVALAGLWTLFVPLLKRPVLVAAEPFGLRFAVLAAAFLLFAPPLTLLGMVSPYAIRLRASALGVVGRTAGNLYALSTIGGVAAALLTGFVLIPSVGVNRLLQMIGMALVGLVALGFLLDPAMRRRPVVPAVLLGAGLVSLATISFRGPRTDEGLLAVRESPYAEIRVVDARGRRHLLIDGGTHTIVNPWTGESMHPYTAVVGLARNLFQAPGKMLLVGLGGGSVVRDFESHGWKVETVEIDSVVSEIAVEFFNLDPAAIVHLEDGRRFLLERGTLFDLIVMDAFGSSSIPFHLVTEESFGLIRSRLLDDGIFVVNTESMGWDSRLIRSLAATLRPHFQHVWALPAFRSPDDLGNIVLVASDHPISLLQPLVRDLAQGAERHRIFAWDNRFEPGTKGAVLLTDDLNPVDLWSESINLSARRALHDYFQDNADW